MSSRSPSPGTPPGRTGTTDLSGGRPAKFNNGWTKEQEDLMAGWADIAGCYRWMHDRCEKLMTRSNMWITVPVIILSTLTGSANFMLQTVVGDDKEAQTYAQIGIGGVSIFTGILTTLGNFFRYAQSSEANRVAGVAWGKFQRQVAVELALHPKERIDSMDFLKICRAELDRLIEQSPPIPDNVILAFEKEFKDIPTLKKPDISHGMEHTKVFDSKETRMTQMAVDAAIMLKQKRKVWHEAMMPEVDRRLDVQIQKAVTDLSGNLFKTLQERIKELERTVEEQAAKAVEDKRGVAMGKAVHLKSFVGVSGGSSRRDSSAAQLAAPLAARTLRQLRPNITVPPTPPAQTQAPPLTQTPLTRLNVDHVIPSASNTGPEHLIQVLTAPAASRSFSMSFDTGVQIRPAAVTEETERPESSEGEEKV